MMAINFTDKSYWVVWLVLGASQAWVPAPTHADDNAPQATLVVEFTKDILPIFERHCHSCHGPDVAEGNLRLDEKEKALAGGDRGPPWSPGAAKDSLLIQLVTGANAESLRMPPDGEPLTNEQIRLLSAWIDTGAEWPANVSKLDRARQHWAYQPIVRPIPPTTDRSDPIHPIDAFVAAKLQAEGIEPSLSADPATLIRRISMDLVGLPPTPEEVEAFEQDSRPDAYLHVVERLLASPHYGERWGRHWLDVARYADSTGYEADLPRPMWHFRDWVVDALNRDLPFDQFVRDQIAGDLIPNATPAQRVATGFLANAPLDPNLRWEAVIDQVQTVGTTFLGLTLSCAQCHSHKTEAISQREFYRFYAYFNAAEIVPLEMGNPSEHKARAEGFALLEACKRQLHDHEQALSATMSSWEASLTEEQKGELPAAAQAILEVPTAQRSEMQRSDLQQLRLNGDARYRELSAAVTAAEAALPKLPTATVMNLQPRPTQVFMRGNPELPGETVQPGTPEFLAARGPVEVPTRLELADWLTSPENPLTARVTVNRIWQQYFGRGLVETEEDFGVQTPPPLHLDLLNWLAAEFRATGWSQKAIHRLIVTSQTYQRSSRVQPEHQERDPNNRLLARQQRLRLEAEVIRDSALAVSGLLNPKLGGPSVFPPQSDSVLEGRATPATWVESTGEDRYRRTLYTWFWRLTPHPYMVLFHAPDSTTTCTRRERTGNSVQALTLLNDPEFIEAARALASQTLAKSLANDDERITFVFRKTLARKPTEEERTLLRQLLTDELQMSAEEATAIAGVAVDDPQRNPRAAWTVVCRSLMNLDEFQTRE